MFFPPNPFILQYFAGAARMNPKHMQTHTTDTRKHTQMHMHILTHTFPGGDESCQQLAEVGSGVCILLSQRKRFQLGGRAAVLEVGLSQGVGVSLEESCSTQTNKDTHKSRCRM